MPLDVKQRGDHVATFRWIEVRLMEILSSWVPTTPEMEVKLLFGGHIWDTAQAADALGKNDFDFFTEEHARQAQHRETEQGARDGQARDRQELGERICGCQPGGLSSGACTTLERSPRLAQAHHLPGSLRRQDPDRGKRQEPARRRIGRRRDPGFGKCRELLWDTPERRPDTGRGKCDQRPRS